MKFFQLRGRHLTYAVSCLVLLIYSSGYPQEVRTNYEILTSILESKLTQMYGSAFKGIDTVTLKVLENQFSSCITERVEVFLNSKGITVSPLNEKTILKLALEQVKVEYPRIVSAPFFGDRKILRQVSAKGYLILINQENDSSIYTSSFDENYVDTIYTNEKVNVENTQFPFLKSELPSESLVRSLVEPITALAVTGTIVYLFFKVRSK